MTTAGCQRQMVAPPDAYAWKSRRAILAVRSSRIGASRSSKSRCSSVYLLIAASLSEIGPAALSAHCITAPIQELLGTAQSAEGLLVRCWRSIAEASPVPPVMSCGLLPCLRPGPEQLLSISDIDRSSRDINVGNTQFALVADPYGVPTRPRPGPRKAACNAGVWVYDLSLASSS